MAKKKNPKLYKRIWLNKDRGSAYMIIDASHDSHWDKKKYPDDRSLGASLEIKDCNRQCAIEFDAYNEKTYKQRLVKIRTLIEGLQALENFMIEHPVIRSKDRDKQEELTEEYIDAEDFLNSIQSVDSAEEEGALTVTTEAVNDRPASKVLESDAVLLPVRPRYTKDAITDE